jgi:hypothetical protein
VIEIIRIDIMPTIPNFQGKKGLEKGLGSDLENRI